ncbi:MAG: hypothetical protein U5K75_04605 [Ahrensia sp.]|nr:hypothetical protein [Ahrensia sp.]
MIDTRDINTRIEAHRNTLLRMVLCWQFAAQWAVGRRNRQLPRRVGSFILSLFFKAELAACYMIVALCSVHMRQRGCLAFPSPTTLRLFSARHQTAQTITLFCAVKRLRRLIHVLKTMREIALVLARRHIAQALKLACHQRFLAQTPSLCVDFLLMQEHEPAAPP